MSLTVCKHWQEQTPSGDTGISHISTQRKKSRFSFLMWDIAKSNPCRTLAGNASFVKIPKHLCFNKPIFTNCHPKLSSVSNDWMSVLFEDLTYWMNLWAECICPWKPLIAFPAYILYLQSLSRLPAQGYFGLQWEWCNTAVCSRRDHENRISIIRVNVKIGSLEPLLQLKVNLKIRLVKELGQQKWTLLSAVR